MKETEVLALLTKMAAYDQRTIGDADVAAWHEVLPSEVGLADALALVPKHYATSRMRMMPADVIEAVTAIRRERLQRAGTPPIPADLTWQQEKAWRQLWCEAVKDGDADPETYANEALGIQPLAIEATSESVAAERKALVQKLAESKAAPKPEPEQRKPNKPRERWGCWLRGTPQVVDGTDVIVYSSAGVVLFHGNDTWGIEIRDLRSDLVFWLNHVAAKGWGDSATLTALARAWSDLSGADDDKRAWAIAMVSDAIDPKAEADEIDVPIAVEMEIGTDDGKQRLAFDPDYSDLWAHAWTHDTEVNIDEYRPETETDGLDGGDQ